MFKNILFVMKERIRTREYIVTIHADEEMDADELSIFDVENCVLNGEIIERQRDKDSGEWKYVLSGKTLDNQSMKIICKLSITDKLVIITVFAN